MSKPPEQPDNFLKIVAGKSVAIVGNSMALLRQNAADKIDSHDVVVRMNRGLPGTIDPKAIGMKTTIWAVAKYWPDLHFPEGAKMAIWMKLTPMGKEHYRAFCKRFLCQGGLDIFHWTQREEDECREFVGADPGTGIRMLWLLKTKCSPRSVSCYGMDCWEEVSHWSGKRNTPNHSPQLERAAMLRLL